jgi:hypothetical protein
MDQKDQKKRKMPEDDEETAESYVQFTGSRSIGTRRAEACTWCRCRKEIGIYGKTDGERSTSYS